MKSNAGSQQTNPRSAGCAADEGFPQRRPWHFITTARHHSHEDPFSTREKWDSMKNYLSNASHLITRMASSAALATVVGATPAFAALTI